jgi:hypothetical protein
MEHTTLATKEHLKKMLLLGLGASALLLISALLVAFRAVHQINNITGTSPTARRWPKTRLTISRRNRPN